MKTDVLAAVVDWPQEWREAFTERAGILEYDAGLSRQEAERRAYRMVDQMRKAQNFPAP